MPRDRPSLMSRLPDYSQSRNPVFRQFGNLSNRRQLFDVASQPWIPLDLFNDSTGAWNNPLQMMGLGGVVDGARNLFGRTPAGQPLPGWMQPGAPMPASPTGYQNPLGWIGEAGNPSGPPNVPYGGGQGVFPQPAPSNYRPNGVQRMRNSGPSTPADHAASADLNVALRNSLGTRQRHNSQF